MAQATDDGRQDIAPALHRIPLGIDPYDRAARAALVALGGEPPPLPEEHAVPAELLAAYAGEYQAVSHPGETGSLTVERGTHLLVTQGQQTQRLRAQTDDRFAAPWGSWTFRPHEDAYEVVLESPWGTFVYRRSEREEEAAGSR